MKLFSRPWPARVVAFVATSVPLAVGARELEYRAPRECPSAADVTARIEARAPSGRDLGIDVEKSNGGFRGALVVGSGEGRLARRIEARTCEAVVEALVLVAVLDRGDRDDEPLAKAPETTAPAPEESTTAPPTPTSVGASPEASVDAAPPVPHHRVEVAAGGALTNTTLVGGDMLLGGALFLDAAAPTAFGPGALFLGPSIRTSIGRTLRTTLFRASSDSASLLLTTGGLDLCPLGIGSRTFASLMACAHGEVGSLEVGIADDAGSSQGHLWSSAGGLLRARLAAGSPGSVRALVELSAGALAPLARDRFHLPGQDPFRASPLLFAMSVGAGVVFP